MSYAYCAFGPLGAGDDSNGSDLLQRKIAAKAIGHPIKSIFIILTDPEPVCLTSMKHGRPDRTYNLPDRTACQDITHWSRARQVYNDRHNHALVTSNYNEALEIFTYSAPLHPAPVPEDAGGE